jgi:hypothetical protein
MPEAWELTTARHGIRYPKPTAPAKNLPAAFEHLAHDLDQLVFQGTVGAREPVLARDLAYAPGWAAVSEPTKIRFWTHDPFLIVSGRAHRTSGAAWLVGTLPEDARPQFEILAPAIAVAGAVAGPTTQVSIKPDGTITAVAANAPAWGATTNLTIHVVALLAPPTVP